MTLIPPTTKEIADNFIANLESTLSQTIPLLPKSFLRVLSKVLAGIYVINYKLGAFNLKQTFVSSAQNVDTDIGGVTLNPLTEWGRLIGVGDPTSATNAELTIDITVVNQVGVLASGTQFVNSTTGVVYLSIGVTILNAPVVQTNIRAVSDQSDGGGAGVIGNMEVGQTLAFAQPLPNIDSTVTVAAIVTTAADAEATEVYRQRVLDRFQKRPQGGAYADYEQWAEEVEGIINAYPYTGDNAGEVDVYTEATPASSGSADGIPNASQLTAVLDSIEFDDAGLPTRRPANAAVNSFPITRLAFSVEVGGLIVTDIGQVQLDITQALEEFFLSREPFIAGLSVLPRKDIITQTGVAGVVEDIVSAAGGIFSTAVVKLNGAQTAIYPLQAGEKAKTSVVYL